jgi:phenylacetate-CoA ligase
MTEIIAGCRDQQPMHRRQLQELQLGKLQSLLGPVLESNDFYGRKLRAAGVRSPEDVSTIEAYRQLPFTTKQELSSDQAEHPPYGTNLTFPADRYVRLHQTSGTTGRRLRWLDTEESWQWFGSCWRTVFEGAGVCAGDRIFFAFSFGPFIGFWTAWEGARQLGVMAIPGGGMSSEQRLDAIVANKATVLLSTPTYALHLAEVAAGMGLDTAGDTAVRICIHGGEPGAGLSATRERIETVWGAQVYDHAGATEVGAWSFECQSRDGLHLNEAEFICEVADPTTLAPTQEGELVITGLGRTGMPVIRYRTGDRVRLQSEDAGCSCSRSFRKLVGGVIGRVDDALSIRGMVVYPSAIENVVRRFPEVGEFAVDVHRPRALDELEIRLEDLSASDEEGKEFADEAGADIAGPEVAGTSLTDRVTEAFHAQLGLRARVTAVPRGSLPRFELKAKRFTDHRRMGAEDESKA